MKNKNFKYMLAGLFLGFALAGMPVVAADLSQAKAAGYVGERMNGFLGLVDPNAPADVKALVQEINSLREAEYQRIAIKNGVAAEDVGKLTAQKVIGQTPSGQYVETPSGWQKR
ncbi:MAG: DUF1318 domain-containing protein [Methylobacter sp.]|uniref:YdbL family protein n=1 Tax=Methylovulum miyakonense TaxID=645578 RepID=UPI0003769EA0|nr:YdbL family protein [Methylovulum miyakonense]PPD38904.1 MAG: DUF1318 domain-containing protein [Methylobacter sp.]